jgi:hypothetical protein
MSDVDLKLGRAEHHRDDLAGILNEYRRRKPYRVSERSDESRGKPYKVVYAQDLEPAPEDAALIFGDVVHNLRATLDYLIGELRPGGPTPTSQFPICDTVDSFNKVRASQVAGVPKGAVAAIELMQAYGPIPDPERSDQLSDEDRSREVYRPLRWLQTLWNVDKHRALSVASGWIAVDWASHNRGQDSGIGYRDDIANGRSEWWMPLDERDSYLDARFDVRVSVRPPRSGAMSDWPDRVNEFEVDNLAETLCWVVRWMVLRVLDPFRLP